LRHERESVGVVVPAGVQPGRCCRLTIPWPGRSIATSAKCLWTSRPIDLTKARGPRLASARQGHRLPVAPTQPERTEVAPGRAAQEEAVLQQAEAAYRSLVAARRRQADAAAPM